MKKCLSQNKWLFAATHPQLSGNQKKNPPPKLQDPSLTAQSVKGGENFLYLPKKEAFDRLDWEVTQNSQSEAFTAKHAGGYFHDFGNLDFSYWNDIDRERSKNKAQKQDGAKNS